MALQSGARRTIDANTETFPAQQFWIEEREGLLPILRWDLAMLRSLWVRRGIERRRSHDWFRWVDRLRSRSNLLSIMGQDPEIGKQTCSSAGMLEFFWFTIEKSHPSSKDLIATAKLTMRRVVDRACQMISGSNSVVRVPSADGGVFELGVAPDGQMRGFVPALQSLCGSQPSPHCHFQSFGGHMGENLHTWKRSGSSTPW